MARATTVRGRINGSTGAYLGNTRTRMIGPNTGNRLASHTLDYLFKTEEEENLADALSDLTKEAEEEDQAVREENKAKRDMERAAKVAHMKRVKEEVKKAAQKSADDMDSYIVLSFDNVEHKNTFMQRFGYSTSDKFIKGEDFDMRCEVADMEE